MTTVYLGAGCFWGVQAVFDLAQGISETSVGYCAGSTKNPTYEEVCSKNTGHVEAVKITFNENFINIKKLLDLFFIIHNPFQVGGQGNDIGPQYRSGIYYDKFLDPSTKEEISNYLDRLKNSTPGITTELKLIDEFFDAESYHQKYLIKNPSGYCHINMTNVVKFMKENEYL
ncbi:MAG: peptide-methionine (S)-S-oxide reductase [Halobacteriovoraceae bacterium]|nr:peptide-methionine (S)-S-oxide reductase [Halobacteriovoraceae bacterium]